MTVITRRGVSLLLAGARTFWLLVSTFFICRDPGGLAAADQLPDPADDSAGERRVWVVSGV